MLHLYLGRKKGYKWSDDIPVSHLGATFRKNQESFTTSSFWTLQLQHSSEWLAEYVFGLEFCERVVTRWLGVLCEMKRVKGWGEHVVADWWCRFHKFQVWECQSCRLFWFSFSTLRWRWRHRVSEAELSSCKVHRKKWSIENIISRIWIFFSMGKKSWTAGIVRHFLGLERSF